MKMCALSLNQRKLCITVLVALPQHGWDNLPLSDLCSKSKIPAKTLANKADLLPLIVQMINEDVKRMAGPQSITSDPGDRIFDLLMTRFECLQTHRAGITYLSDICRQRPDMALQMYKCHVEAMASLLDLAKLSKKSPFKIHLLLGIYHSTFPTWQRDKTPDMAQTMAKLNGIIEMCKAATALT